MFTLLNTSGIPRGRSLTLTAIGSRIYAESLKRIKYEPQTSSAADTCWCLTHKKLGILEYCFNLLHKAFSCYRLGQKGHLSLICHYLSEAQSLSVPRNAAHKSYEHNWWQSPTVTGKGPDLLPAMQTKVSFWQYSDWMAHSRRPSTIYFIFEVSLMDTIKSLF